MTPPTLPGMGTPKMEPCPTCHGSGEIDADALADLTERPGKHSGAKTSRVAGTTPRKGSQRHQVLAALRTLGPMTAYELSSLVHKSPNQTATRLGELHDDLFVVYLRDADGAIEERPTTPGNTGMVHTLTPLGERILRELDARS